MDNCVIHKIEWVTDKVVFTPIGYSLDSTFCDTINADYDSTLGSWVTTNMVDLEASTTSISDFFGTTPIVHVARTHVTSTDGLTLITEV